MRRTRPEKPTQTALRFELAGGGDQLGFGQPIERDLHRNAARARLSTVAEGVPTSLSMSICKARRALTVASSMSTSRCWIAEPASFDLGVRRVLLRAAAVRDMAVTVNGELCRASLGTEWLAVELRRQTEAAEAGEEAGEVFAGEFVLPDAKDAPAGFAERAVDEAISGLIAGDFGEPEFRVLLGLCAVDRAAVPEAAVDEDGEAKFGKNEIGFTGEPTVSPPAGDADSTHDRDQTELGVFVTGAANARHDGGAFFAGENVGRNHLSRTVERANFCQKSLYGKERYSCAGVVAFMEGFRNNESHICFTHFP